MTPRTPRRAGVTPGPPRVTSKSEGGARLSAVAEVDPIRVTPASTPNGRLHRSNVRPETVGGRARTEPPVRGDRGGPASTAPREPSVSPGKRQTCGEAARPGSSGSSEAFAAARETFPAAAVQSAQARNGEDLSDAASEGHNPSSATSRMPVCEQPGPADAIGSTRVRIAWPDEFQPPPHVNRSTR